MKRMWKGTSWRIFPIFLLVQTISAGLIHIAFSVSGYMMTMNQPFKNAYPGYELRSPISIYDLVTLNKPPGFQICEMSILEKPVTKDKIGIILLDYNQKIISEIPGSVLVVPLESAINPGIASTVMHCNRMQPLYSKDLKYPRYSTVNQFPAQTLAPNNNHCDENHET